MPVKLTDLPNDQDFQAASPQARQLVFDHLAAQDPDFQAASPDAQNLVRSHVLGGSDHGSSGSWEENPGPVKRFLSNAGEELNPITMVKGAAQLIAHPGDALQADTDYRGKMQDQAKQDLQQGNLVKGTIGTVESMVPFLGSAFGRMSDQADSGDLAGALGKASGMGLSMALPGLAEGAVAPTGEMATKLYRRALMPPPTTNASKVAMALDRGLQEGIPISKSGVEKMYSALENYEDVKPDFSSEAGKTPIPVQPILDRLDALKGEAAKGALPTKAVQAIEDAREEFLTADRPGGAIRQPDGSLRNLTAQEAQDMKQATQQAVGTSYQRSIVANPITDFSVKTQQEIASALKDELATRFPDLAASNEAQHELLSLKPLLERRVAALANHSKLGIGTPLTAMGVKAATGFAGQTVSSIAASAAGVGRWVFDNPAIRSHVAIALSKASEIPISEAMTQVQGFINGLTLSAANESEPAQPTVPPQEGPPPSPQRPPGTIGHDAATIQPLAPPDPAAQQAVNSQFQGMSLQNVADTIRGRWGISKPIVVKTGYGNVPSQTDRMPDGSYQITLHPAKAQPWAVQHEMRHVLEDVGGVSAQPHDNDALAGQFLQQDDPLATAAMGQLAQRPYRQGMMLVDMANKLRQGQDISEWAAQAGLTPKEGRQVGLLASLSDATGPMNMLTPPELDKVAQAVPEQAAIIAAIQRRHTYAPKKHMKKIAGAVSAG